MFSFKSGWLNSKGMEYLCIVQYGWTSETSSFVKPDIQKGYILFKTPCAAKFLLLLPNSSPTTHGYLHTLTSSSRYTAHEFYFICIWATFAGWVAYSTLGISSIHTHRKSIVCFGEKKGKRKYNIVIFNLKL